LRNLRACFSFFSAVPRYAPLLLVLVSCAQARYGAAGSAENPCKLIDSLYARAFLQAPFVLKGKARFDVNQYRLRGQFVLTVRPAGPASPGSAGTPGTVSFDFVSSSYFGSQREDMTITLSNGITGILDRERDTYLEGGDADRFIAERLGVKGDFKQVIDLALGVPPACGTMQPARATTTAGGGMSIRGTVRGQPARVDFAGPARKLREIAWPFEVEAGRMRELRISYGWADDGDRLEALTMTLGDLQWQIKLNISDAD
jgi:hypothetical protein